MATQAEKQRLQAEIKQLKQQHEALEVTHQRYTKTMRGLQARIFEIEQEQLKISVAKWRAENELGIEQLLMF